MDYNELLAFADQKQNHLNASRLHNGRLNGYKGPNPAAIAAYKARKEREERERAAHAARNRDLLLSLRAQNSKSAKKAKAMTQRTRENDFSRITVNEGQVKDSEKVEAKIRKSGIKGTKERMKARIQMDEKLARLTRRDKEKFIARMERDEPVKVVAKSQKMSDVLAQMKEERMKSPFKTARPAAPTLSYDQILNMADENANKRCSLEEHIKSEMEQKKMERPMTAKEKERAKEEMYYKNRAKMARLPTADERAKAEMTARRRISVPAPPPPPEPEDEPYEPEPMRKKTEPGPRLNGQFRQRSPERYSPPPSRSSSTRPVASYQPTPRPAPASNGAAYRQANGQTRPNGHQQARPAASTSTQRAPPGRPDRERMPPAPRGPPPPAPRYRPEPSSRPPADRGPPPKPTSTSRGPPPRPRAYSPQPATRSNLPPIGATYRRGMYADYEPEPLEEDEYYDEEDDDEMADFIDDGPEDDVYAPEPEYRRAIREIFGYDKRKYLIDDDDDIEEASFSQCMKEEKASLRAGIQEDLEDIKREEEEARAKAARKKARR